MKTYFLTLLAIVLITSLGIPTSAQEQDSRELADSAAVADSVAADAAAEPYRSWTPFLLLSVFVLLIIIPFMPGFIEVTIPKDRYPLPVKNTRYAKDPRYLGKSARRILAEALEGKILEDGQHAVLMSKEETLDVSDQMVVPINERVENVQYVRDDLQTEAGVRFNKEVFVGGKAHIGAKSRLRTLACDGAVTMGEETRVARWLDAEGEITVGDGCNLGVSAASPRGISLGDRVQFKRLFGNPVTTPDYIGRENTQPSTEPPRGAKIPNKIRTIKDTLDLHRRNLTLAEGEELEANLVVKGDLTCDEGSRLRGSAKVYGSTVLKKNAMVMGDIFSEGPVTVGKGAVVLGNIFSQDAVKLLPGARLGREGALKSVIGKKEVHIAQNVSIHGYVLTEGRGRVVREKSSSSRRSQPSDHIGA
ncbi:MAG: hypothetical protein AMJ92_10210 [candidate division Zixibacteria bacterium SM23_81]|nr:MAG: hypothetical protein AMJ92_10210 [candidate division Zixibacteria bacterium SM23_81]